MRQRIRGRAAQVMKCSAVLAVGIAVAPSGVALEDASEAEATVVDRRATTRSVQRRGEVIAHGRDVDDAGAQDVLPAATLAELPGLDRTYLLCLAASSPVDVLRLAAARALASPLGAIGERTVAEVRLAAARAVVLRGIRAESVDETRES